MRRERAPCACGDGTMAANALQWLQEELTAEFGDKLVADRACRVLLPPALEKAVELVRSRWQDVEDLAACLSEFGAISI